MSLKYIKKRKEKMNYLFRFELMEYKNQVFKTKKKKSI